jgi:hypothetical protein
MRCARCISEGDSECGLCGIDVSNARCHSARLSTYAVGISTDPPFALSSARDLRDFASVMH